VGVAGGSDAVNAEDFLDAAFGVGDAEAPEKKDEVNTEAQRRGGVEGSGSGEERLTEEDEEQGAGSREQEEVRSGLEEEELRARAEAEVAAEAEAKAEAEALAAAASGEVKIGQFEQGVLKTLREKGVPEALVKRTSALFVKDIKNRQAIAERDEKITNLETQLGEVASKATLVPSGPLAHLDTQEKVDEAHREATHNLDWIENKPSNWQAYFPDDGEEVPEANRQTGEQKLESFRRRNLEMLKLLPAQSKVVTQRAGARETLKAKLPTVFETGHADAKLLAEFYQTDPRQRADADEVFRLYLKGKRIEEEEASGDAKWHRVDLKSTSKTAKSNGAANGNGHENGRGLIPPKGGTTNSESESRKSSNIQLPAPKSAARIPVKPQGLSPKEQINQQLQAGSVDAEAWAEAQASN
jgi:hypothetical protein